MKDYHTLIFNRRSIRKYTDEELSPDDIRLIFEAGLVSPSGKNKMPWQFIAIEDKSLLHELSQCKDYGAAPITNCVLAIVVIADPIVSDTWVEDATIAAFNIQLQAADLGIGSCWIQIRDRFNDDGTSAEDFVRSRLSIPDQMRVLTIVTLGKSAETRKPYNPEQCKWEKVHIGNWSEHNSVE